MAHRVSHGYCSTLWLPFHPVPSAGQQSSEEIQGLFSLRRGGQDEPALVCTEILIIFKYNSLNILCTALYQI